MARYVLLARSGCIFNHLWWHHACICGLSKVNVSEDRIKEHFIKRLCSKQTDRSVSGRRAISRVITLHFYIILLEIRNKINEIKIKDWLYNTTLKTVIRVGVVGYKCKKKKRRGGGWWSRPPRPLPLIRLWLFKCPLTTSTSPLSILELCPSYEEFTFKKITDKWQGPTQHVRLKDKSDCDNCKNTAVKSKNLGGSGRMLHRENLDVLIRTLVGILFQDILVKMFCTLINVS